MYVQSLNKKGYIALETRPGVYSHRIDVYSRTFEKNSSHGHSTVPATKEQIAHLEACIAADGYLPWNDNMLTPQYEIY